EHLVLRRRSGVERGAAEVPLGVDPVAEIEQRRGCGALDRARAPQAGEIGGRRRPPGELRELLFPRLHLAVLRLEPARCDAAARQRGRGDKREQAPGSHFFAPARSLSEIQTLTSSFIEIAPSATLGTDTPYFDIRSGISPWTTRRCASSTETFTGIETSCF